jgi:putative IMPACT (imprinted ancient) family translation regulator
MPDTLISLKAELKLIKSKIKSIKETKKSKRVSKPKPVSTKRTWQKAVSHFGKIGKKGTPLYNDMQNWIKE